MEELRKVKNNALVPSAPPSSIRTMAEMDYDPISELIGLTREMKGLEVRDYKLEVEVHKTLLKYKYPPAPTTLAISTQTQHNVTLMRPSQSMLELAGQELLQCNPEIVDVTGGLLSDTRPE